MEWKDKMYLVLFQAPQKTKLLRFLFFVGYSFRLLVETCVCLYVFNSKQPASHIWFTAGLYTHAYLASHLLCKTLVFLFLCRQDRRIGVVQEIMEHIVEILRLAFSVRCSHLTSFHCSPSCQKKKKEEKNPTNILFPPSGAVWSSVLHRK